MNLAIVFAGGSGVRMGAGIPKQFLEINGRPVIIHTLQLFQFHQKIDKIYVACIEEYIDYMKELIEEYHLNKVIGVIPGGTTGQESVYKALLKAKEDNPPDSIVLIHDGVRPYISYDVISNNIDGVKKCGSAITCIPCSETILLSESGTNVDKVPYRKELYIAQAPQSFYLKDVLDAHDRIRNTERGYENIVDACTLFNSLGESVYMVEGNRGNIKITTPEDVYLFRALLQYKENEQAFGLGLTNPLQAKMQYYQNKK